MDTRGLRASMELSPDGSGYRLQPLLAIVFTHLANVRSKKRRPRTIDEIDQLFAIVLRSWFERNVRPDFLKIDVRSVGNGHFANRYCSDRFQLRAMVSDHVGKPLLRDRKDRRLQAFPKQLSTDFEAGEVRSRGSITNQVLHARSFPEWFTFSAHNNRA